MNDLVKLRFCPSPTGLMHLGNTRTALFNALYALKARGVFLLRIEDTDQTRSKLEFAEQLQADLQWLGLDWQEGPGPEGDNGPYWQSQRQSLYDQFYDTLIENDFAYSCFCSESQLALTRKVQRASGQPPRYPGTCRSLSPEEVEAKLAEGLKPTLRFKMPKQTAIEFTDTVKGPQRFMSNDIGDFVIRRTDKTAPFMYCNAIDDALMGVTHVLRGEDHLTNTPRQIMILQALDLPVPAYGHITLIVGPDGAPLSKRNGSRSVQDLRDTGFLAIAVNNYLARLGHYYENNKLMSLADLAAGFGFEQLGKSPARFDESQLRYWQAEAVAQAESSELWDWMGEAVHAIVPTDKQADFIETIRPNITFPNDALRWAKAFFVEPLEYTEEAKAAIEAAGVDFFKAASAAAESQASDFKLLSTAVKEQTGAKGKGLFQPLRAALTGDIHGPEMARVVGLLGEQQTIERLSNVL